MLGIANYAMKGPTQALIAIVIFAALSVFLAPFGIIVGALIALVTLRVSVSEGFKTLVWGVLSHVGLTLLLTGSMLGGFLAVAEYMLPVWLMAVVLRQTNSLASALQFAMVLVGVLVVGFHLMVADTSQWWLSLFNQYLAPVLQASQIEYEVERIAQITDHFTMLVAVFMIVLWFSILVVGRWWQSELYYPGRFKTDFYQLALPKSTAYVAIALAVLGLLNASQNSMINDLSSVLIAGLMMQGIAIAHHTVATKEMRTAWLVGLYILLFLVPESMLVLATIGLVDTWVDFRNRWTNKEL
ncbi:DUF2232 domain-containing protein [Thiomicrorhabdus sediminis]|uniref:DUF2232 domain-containing protein n=2 Tax=Thiomicrorhabdus sediminis TaxID=2580412 RepID=A0A4P9K712_9GAMM|nr:DUF2232 domain-containing protein [Thiomicrorhabdus sediminis]